MSKITVNFSVLVLSAVLIFGSAFGVYNTERGRCAGVSENQSYIYCAGRTLSLAAEAGKTNEKPATHAADTSRMPEMQAELTWLAEYDSTLSRLDRAYAELSTSPAVSGAEASYAEACSAAVSLHRAQIDDINAQANVLNAVCAAVFILGIAGAAWSALRLSKEN